jgi:hypothetical protein
VRNCHSQKRYIVKILADYPLPTDCRKIWHNHSQQSQIFVYLWSRHLQLRSYRSVIIKSQTSKLNTFRKRVKNVVISNGIQVEISVNKWSDVNCSDVEWTDVIYVKWIYFEVKWSEGKWVTVKCTIMYHVHYGDLILRVASCTMGTGSFPWVKGGRGVLLSTQPLLVQRSRKSRSIPLPTL